LTNIFVLLLSKGQALATALLTLTQILYQKHFTILEAAAD